MIHKFTKGVYIMNFETKHDVTNNVFTTEISFAGYGTDSMDEKHEQALFNDLGNPAINLGSIIFEGKFSVDGDKRVVDAAADATDANADTVKFIVNAKRYELAPGFVVSKSFDAGDVAESELGKKLTTPRLVAEAKALLFQEKILDAIKKSVEDIKAQRTRFETEEVATLTV